MAIRDRYAPFILDVDDEKLYSVHSLGLVIESLPEFRETTLHSVKGVLSRRSVRLGSPSGYLDLENRPAWFGFEWKSVIPESYWEDPEECARVIQRAEKHRRKRKRRMKWRAAWRRGSLFWEPWLQGFMVGLVVGVVLCLVW